MGFDSIYPNILKKCFRKEYLCVSVCRSVCPSPNLEPKPFDRFCSKSISGVFSQISRAVFLVFPLPLKLRVVHIRKKNSIFSKMAPTILIKFCGFIVQSKDNNVTLSAFPGKIPETGKIYFKFLSVS